MFHGQASLLYVLDTNGHAFHLAPAILALVTDLLLLSVGCTRAGVGGGWESERGGAH